LVKVKLSAGVVLGVATLVVKSGERMPAVKFVTLPGPPPPPHALELLVKVYPVAVMFTLKPEPMPG
jgi:hypothetical protein